MTGYLSDRKSEIQHFQTSRSFLYTLRIRPCNKLFASGFVDDVMFVHNGPWCVAKRAYSQSESPGGSIEVKVMMSTITDN